MAKKPVKVETLTHDKASRRNIPTAEYQSVAERIEEQHPAGPAHYKRADSLPEGAKRERDEDLDPQIIWQGARIRVSKEQARQLVEKGEIEIGEAQLVWRGKDRQDWSDLVVQKPPIYIQEKIHPKAIIDDLKRRTKETSDAPDLFADFNGLHDPEMRTEFYQHDQNWSNRFILGDSLSVMASLAEREGLRGKVQCIYFDPPYGKGFNSNWQVSTLSRDVKDGKREDVSREPEQIRAFRDTWKDGIHSYLTYPRDRLSVARELLTESGSIFVQIGDENVHRVRAVMDEVFGAKNFVVSIVVKKTGSQISSLLDAVNDYIIWYGRSTRDSGSIKARTSFLVKESSEVFQTFNMVDLDDMNRLSISELGERDGIDYSVSIDTFRETYPAARLFALHPLKSGGYRRNQSHPFRFQERAPPFPLPFTGEGRPVGPGWGVFATEPSPGADPWSAPPSPATGEGSRPSATFSCARRGSSFACHCDGAYL